MENGKKEFYKELYGEEKFELMQQKAKIDLMMLTLKMSIEQIKDRKDVNALDLLQKLENDFNRILTMETLN